MTRAAGSRSRNVASVIDSIGGIDEHGDANRTRHQFTQQFQPFCRQLGSEKIDSRQVAARPGEARDQTQPDRVFARRRRQWESSWLPPWPRTREAACPQRSRRPDGEPDRPPAPAAGRVDCRPSGIRSPHSRPRRSRPPSGPGEIRADAPPSRQAMGYGGIRSPASPAAARARRAATHRRATQNAEKFPPPHVRP